MPFGSIGKKYGFVFLWLAMLTTAGCDVSMPSPNAPRGEARTEKLNTNIPIDEARDIAKPIGETPGLSVDVPNPMGTPDGMSEARGLNVRLFDTAVSDDERFERLEGAVQKLRDDFDSVAPAINRLIAIEREIQGLVDQLEVLVGNENGMDSSSVPPIPTSLVEEETIDPVVPNIPDPLPPQDITPPSEEAMAQDVAAPSPTMQAQPQQQPQAQQPQPTTPAFASTLRIEKIRAANHAKMSRIVIELAQAPKYSAVITPENTLMITFDGAQINADFEDKGAGSSLVSGTSSVAPSDSGYVLSIPLKRASRIVSQGVLKPDGAVTTHRLYFDLAL